MTSINVIFNYRRRKSIKVLIGNLCLGGDSPIRIQSMANTDTNDISASVEQGKNMIDAGAELIRYTAQGIREAKSLELISKHLLESGYNAPLVADIHFNANVAYEAVKYVDKVRINPGNFVGSVKNKGDDPNYSEQEFELERRNLKEKLSILIAACKENNKAIRIGVNHGSLSERMLIKYGDTPKGMVESCMEVLNICRELNFDQIVISLKASNVLTMVHAVRLLVQTMEYEDFCFPIHLGVTEAGDGEDGRIKSAVGIGALLSDGIGDTIRVSLSEEPEKEIPVAQKLVAYIGEKASHVPIVANPHPLFHPLKYNRRVTTDIGIIGGENVPIVLSCIDHNKLINSDLFLIGDEIVDAKSNSKYPIINKDNFKSDIKNNEINFIKLTFNDLNSDLVSFLNTSKKTCILLETNHINGLGEQRAFFHYLLNHNIKNPVIICRKYDENDLETLVVKASVDIGTLLIDGFGDGIFIECHNFQKESLSIAYGILQSTRIRMTKTDYISCPGCGRTLFDLQKVVAKVKSQTNHLTGLKIAVMGCIVNGPGEMADADYGYVGAARGKVSLYKKNECVERNIPENEAIEKLIELIKQNNDWVGKDQGI